MTIGKIYMLNGGKPVVFRGLSQMAVTGINSKIDFTRGSKKNSRQ
ncbi:MAG: hypothetical protein JWR61_1793 [Ferruginibacter sp.]|nr:hypothetical protein [Ferruginibacter sp.]